LHLLCNETAPCTEVADMNGCPCFTRSCLCPFISLETNISISVLAYGWGYPDRALDDGVWDELISNGVGAQLMRCNMPAPSRRLGSIRIWCMVVTRQGAMTFAIHASKNGQSVVTVRISPDATADKARLLESFGWQVHITDSAGRQFDVSGFDRFLSGRSPHNDVSRLEKFN
jgi:hypothetical protein